MASLTGSAIKDTYAGLLKFTDNSGATASLKTISDGEGTAVALSLSTSTAKAAALEIENVAEDATGTKSLVWDDTTKQVSYRTTSAFGGITFGASGTSTPTISALDSVGGGGTITLQGGGGITLAQENDTITISAGAGDVQLITAATALTVADFGKTFFIDTDGTTGFDISLPEAIAGNEITFVIYEQSNATHRIITTGSAEYFFGAVTVIGDTVSGTSTQRVSRNTARVDSTNHNAYELAASAAAVGGLVGDVISMKCYDGSGWSVSSTHGTLAGVAASVDVITGQ